MKLILKDYRANKQFVINSYNKKGVNGISEFSCLVGIPMIACCMFVLEEFEDILVSNKLKSLLDYYKYDEIL